MERHSRDRDSTSESRDGREQMPPPNPRRTSTEPADDKGTHTLFCGWTIVQGFQRSTAFQIVLKCNFLNFRFQTSQTRSPG